MDELRRQLREAAEAHRPDRARMLARVERAMTPGRPGPSDRHAGASASWLRITGATAAVAGLLVAGGYAVASATRDERPTHSIAPPPPALTPAPPATGADRAEHDYLRADGLVDPHSNRYWAQSNVRLKTQQPLTALTVELSVTQTGGVADTGSWRSLPAGDFTVSVREENGALVFRWSLKAGRMVPAGQHVFAGQYNHAEGARDAGDDTFSASATARTNGERATLHGDFTGPVAGG
ncbi:hypothetical protein J7E91_13990 [Streptomyces sp. ISL-99]|uniref:hypothetical protein n=1 Tax=Streptomyces sp. ISL-99 TaxID=2819193 RepID=UPI001BE97833|nr:hypothetical protein [Streptomyces sp. ISL-99]MBT2526510.1 hypothetical protein [Streptomyces sp. ISL-99]